MIKDLLNRKPLSGGLWPVLGSSQWLRLMTGAALLHVSLVVCLFMVGRAQIVPGFVDRDGIMESFAYDSYAYRREALGITEIENDETGAAKSVQGHINSKILFLEFSTLGYLFGYSILSAEPFNLFCYLAILCLIMMIGEELGGRRAGTLAALVVALWPSFLLHTTQFLKDPFFIAATLALILIVLTWLTRTYRGIEAVISGAALALTAGALLLIRINFAGFILAIVLLGFVGLIVRQVIERRALYWNMICPVIILSLAIPTAFYLTAITPKFKRYPSDRSGLLKSATGPEEQLSAVISYQGDVTSRSKKPSPYPEWLTKAPEFAVTKIDIVRDNFKTEYRESGSSVDRDVEFKSLKDVLLYLPRAIEIGLWAPFPETWIGAGKRVGSAGKLLSGAETLLIYVCELLVLVTLYRAPRSLANWLLLSISLSGVAALGLVIPNIGTLYRVRYLFWILLIILGMKGLESLWAMRSANSSALSQDQSLQSPPRTVSGAQRVKIRLILAVIVAGLIACASCRPRNDSTSRLDFILVNATDSKIRGLYLSPHDAVSWEENLLGSDELSSGGMIKIKFRPEEQAVMWDLRLDVGKRSHAEWKNLNLPEISKFTLHTDKVLNLAKAEAE